MKRRGFSITFVLITLLLSIVISCDKDEEVPNQLPTCKITFPADSIEVDRGDTLTISVAATDSDGNIKEVQFSVDGIKQFSSTGLPYDFTWSTENATLGNHTIKAKSIDSDGGSNSDEINIIIKEPGVAPTPFFMASPLTGVVPLSVNFTDQSINNPTSWQWEFGDGNTSSEQNPSYTYPSQGIYSVKLTVTNEFGTNILLKQDYIMLTNPGPPSIVFASGTHPTSGLPYRNNDFIIDINSQFAIGIIANSNSQNQAELKQLIVTKATGTTNPVTIFDTTFSGLQFNWDNTYFSSYQAAAETYTFKIIDIDEQSEEISITALSQQSDPGIFIFDGKQLGSYESGVNAGFNTRTADGMTYDVFTVPVEEEADVDFIFFNDVGYGLTLMSPENDYLIGMYPPINNWETRNKTMFQKTILTNEHYNSIENKNQLILTIQNFSGIGPFNINYYSEIISEPGGFEVNDIFAFQNPMGLQGLMIIKEIDEGATPGQTTIIFDMKVDKP